MRETLSLSYLIKPNSGEKKMSISDLFQGLEGAQLRFQPEIDDYQNYANFQEQREEDLVYWKKKKKKKANLKM